MAFDVCATWGLTFPFAALLAPFGSTGAPDVEPVPGDTCDFGVAVTGFLSPAVDGFLGKEIRQRSQFGSMGNSCCANSAYWSLAAFCKLGLSPVWVKGLTGGGPAAFTSTGMSPNKLWKFRIGLGEFQSNLMGRNAL